MIKAGFSPGEITLRKKLDSKREEKEIVEGQEWIPLLINILTCFNSGAWGQFICEGHTNKTTTKLSKKKTVMDAINRMKKTEQK